MCLCLCVVSQTTEPLYCLLLPTKANQPAKILAMHQYIYIDIYIDIDIPRLDGNIVRLTMIGYASNNAL